MNETCNTRACVYIYIKHVRYIGGEKLRKTLPSSRKIGMDDHHLEAMYETRTTQRSQCPSGGLSRSQMNQRTNVGLDEARDRRGKKKKRSKRLVGRTRRSF